MSGFAPGVRLLSPVAAMLATALLHACGDDPAAPPGPGEVPAVISPAAQWSGGIVTLQWPWLEGREELPEFRSGDSVLAAERVDGSTVTLTMPYLTTGPATISAIVDEESIPLGSVSVYGFTRSDPMTWLLAVRPWPSPTGAAIIGVDPEDGSVDIVDLASGVSRGTGPLPFNGASADEVGLSYREGVALAFEHYHDDTAYPWVEFWRIDPVPEKVDSLLGNADLSHVLELGPGRFLMQHNGVTWASGFPGFWEEATGTGRMVPSPTWEQVILYQGQQAAIFMFDAVNGGVDYLLPAYRRLLHGAFTPDGAEAFLAVTAQDDPVEVTSVIRIDAATGEERARTTLPVGADWRSVSVAVAGGRVLVAYDDPDLGHGSLRVLRAADLSPEADLPLPDQLTYWAWSPALVAAPGGQWALLATSAQTGVWRYRFDLLPE